MTNHSPDNSSIQEVNKKLFEVIKERKWSISEATIRNEIKELVEKQGADINAQDDTESTVLHEIVKRFFYAENIIKYLIDQGADFEVKDRDGLTPLQQVITAEKIWKNGSDYYGLAEYLLEKGADVNTKDHKGSTPLHKAVFFGNPCVVLDIIKRGADVNAKDNQGSTPLHELVKSTGSGVYSIFQHLDHAKAKIDEPDNEGFTPLLRAVQSRNLDMMVKLLPLGVNFKATNNQGENILDIAFKNQQDNIISKLLTENIEELNIQSDSSYLLALLSANKKDFIYPPRALDNLKLIQKAYENLPDTDRHKSDLSEKIENQQNILSKDLDKYKVYAFYRNHPKDYVVEWSEFRLWKEDRIAQFQKSINFIDKVQENYASSQSIVSQIPEQNSLSLFGLILRPAISWFISKVNAPHLTDISNENTEAIDTLIGEDAEQSNEIES